MRRMRRKREKVFLKGFSFLSFCRCRFFLLACEKGQSQRGKAKRHLPPSPHLYPKGDILLHFSLPTLPPSLPLLPSYSSAPSSPFLPHICCCRLLLLLAALQHFWNLINEIASISFTHSPLLHPSRPPFAPSPASLSATLSNNFQFSIFRDFRLINSIGKVFQNAKLQQKLKASLPRVACGMRHVASCQLQFTVANWQLQSQEINHFNADSSDIPNN